MDLIILLEPHDSKLAVHLSGGRSLARTTTKASKRPDPPGVGARRGSPGRLHQGLGNELVSPRTIEGSGAGEVVETERLGGLLRSYQRAA
jgi:hypothetical protein